MDDAKRMVDTYEVKHAIHVGDKEILFGVDEKKIDCPYIVCNCTWDNPLGIEHYFSAVGSADYLEMMTEFTSRVTAQLETVKAEREIVTVSLRPFTLEHCIQNDNNQNLENKVAIIRPERLRPEYRTADKQLVLITGGFGARANSRGRAVYTTNLYSGKESRWNREDILGIVKPEYMPDWAKERLKQIQAQRQIKLKKQEIER
ncbi:hypothetical protein SAMN02745975_01616 [Geosporobacter subterraneus DSM 17957]|uniref:Uncharacterized protein n=2 Tax=Thermotaleaceae TaxID=3118657 RepID=A0A1M6HRZ1_9FIRM|nr:hypothetical protein [Geosporobacter subterraneus]SHJ24962.1 hypothetical protein SAMN02745975_01616 [Geosporobacter subterraneus DSM 17957]